jgi:transketolase
MNEPAVVTPSHDLQVREVANALRGLAMDAVQQANSGHPGLPMGMADVAAVLWTRFLRYSPADPPWLGRDRFVLSAGHGSMLLYGLLHLAGFPLPLEELKRFRQLDSKTPGHPEQGHTAGVETTTGPLGQGFANAVGFALAAQLEAAWFECPELRTRVFVLASDGDLMEGISHEAASLAGHWKLDNLVCLYDDNKITIEGKTSLAWSDDTRLRFAALGWRTLVVDGHDLVQIQAALEQAVAPAEQPTLVICKTHIAHGSPNKADSHEAHGAPLGAAEVTLTKQRLGLSETPFAVSPLAREVFAAVRERNELERRQWLQEFDRWRAADPARAQRHDAFRARRVPEDLFAELCKAAGEQRAATRVLSGKVLQKAAALVPSLVGGSADLDPSTKTRIVESPSIAAGKFSGRNLHFGVREHGMGAILNGMSLHGGFLPYGSTFLVFADYMRPPMRLAALMRARVGFVFTHDSLLVGEDGPTHQPVEHLGSLRLIPNLHVFRPADGVEVAAAWTWVCTRQDGPVAVILTRQDLPPLPRAGVNPEHALRGGYVLSDDEQPEAAVVATGAEVAPTLEACRILRQSGRRLRLVSMPCVELFERQDLAWRTEVLPAGLPVLAVEMGRPETWCRFTGSLERVVGVTTFGASAPLAQLIERYGFTPEKIAKSLAAHLERQRG